VLGASPGNEIAKDVAARLLKKGIAAGCHDRSGVTVKGEPVRIGEIDTFTAGEMLVMNRNLDAIVLSINGDSVLHTGLPVDRFDILVLAGMDGDEAGVREATRELLELLLPCCTGRVIMLKEWNAGKHGDLKSRTNATWENVTPSSKAAETIAHAMLDARPPA
jgi:cyanophycin synthetase